MPKPSTGGGRASADREEASLPDKEKPDREVLQSLFGPGKDCPAIEQLDRALAASADDSVRKRVTSHLETCGCCRSELELYRMFQAVEVEPSETAAVSEITEKLRARSREIFASHSQQITTRDPWWRSLFRMPWLTPVVLTAAGLLVAVAIGLQLRQSAPPALHPVSDAGQHIMRSTAVVVVTPVGDLRTPPTRVEWHAVPGAAKYRVRLLEVDRNELWAAETDGVHMDLPVAVQARIVAGKSILCQVSAFSETGAALAQSELIRFRVLQNIYPH